MRSPASVCQLSYIRTALLLIPILLQRGQLQQPPESIPTWMLCNALKPVISQNARVEVLQGWSLLGDFREGLKWLCKRKCTDEEITRRDGSVQLWIHKNHIVSGENIWSVEIRGLFFNPSIEDLNKNDIFNNKNNQDPRQSDVISKNYSSSCVCDGEMEKKSGPGIRRKSVSFADDVIVYLYDKDSPAHNLHPEPDNTTSSSSNLLSEILFDNNGLEWEDDFLALEKNCHLHNHPKSCPFSLPTQNWTIPKPKTCINEVWLIRYSGAEEKEESCQHHSLCSHIHTHTGAHTLFKDSPLATSGAGSKHL
ncbi:hypothetical protein WMY93_011113 [Mugilogobius chulae]|uniref:Uncharacterized protein n=1 Tax=Mugilogobius chulae TaxID=88201 RepID=A0AAW0PD69_9GOBI